MLLNTDVVGVTVIAVITKTQCKSHSVSKIGTICEIKQLLEITSEYGMHN